MCSMRGGIRSNEEAHRNRSLVDPEGARGAISMKMGLERRAKRVDGDALLTASRA